MLLKTSYRLLTLARKNNPVITKLIALILVLETIVVGLLYALNTVYGKLYQAIQEINQHDIWVSIATFSALAGVLVLFNGYTGYFINRLAFELRKGLTNISLTLFDHQTEQLPYFAQRVQEDLRKFGESSVEFYTSVFKAILKLIVFISVIVTLSHWYIGAIVFAAAIVGTYLTKVVAKKLITLQSDQESNEANFREILSRYGFDIIERQFRKINTEIKKVSFLQSGLSQGFVLLPFILLMPMYISKAITMGAFFQSVNALGKIIDSLTVLIDNRQLIVTLESVVLRLQGLYKELDS